MITVVVRDRSFDPLEKDEEILRLEFSSIEEADEEMPKVMEDLSNQFGSGACWFYGAILNEKGEPISEE